MQHDTVNIGKQTEEILHFPSGDPHLISKLEVGWAHSAIKETTNHLKVQAR
jgi:hypothetical protein